MRMNKIVWGNSKFVSGVILYSSLTVQISNVKYPPASFNFSIQLWLFVIENTNTQIINWAPVITAVFRLWIWFVEVGLEGFSCETAALTSSALVFDSRTYNQYNDLRSVRWPLDMRWLRWRFRSPPAYTTSLPSLQTSSRFGHRYATNVPAPSTVSAHPLLSNASCVQSISSRTNTIKLPYIIYKKWRSGILLIYYGHNAKLTYFNQSIDIRIVIRFVK